MKSLLVVSFQFSEKTGNKRLAAIQNYLLKTENFKLANS